MTADGHDKERVIVAQWLRFNADRVRVLEAGGAEGLAMRADRIPRLSELCGTLRSWPDPPDRVPPGWHRPAGARVRHRLTGRRPGQPTGSRAAASLVTRTNRRGRRPPGRCR